MKTTRYLLSASIVAVCLLANTFLLPSAHGLTKEEKEAKIASLKAKVEKYSEDMVLYNLDRGQAAKQIESYMKQIKNLDDNIATKKKELQTVENEIRAAKGKKPSPKWLPEMVKSKAQLEAYIKKQEAELKSAKIILEGWNKKDSDLIQKMNKTIQSMQEAQQELDKLQAQSK